jgi:hypothetical protein
MSFKDMVAADIKAVFLNDGEFADLRTVIYDGETYTDIPIVLIRPKESARRQISTGNDHAEGLYLVTAVMHCAKDDLGGNVPEKGQRIKINDAEGGEGFFREFYVASSMLEVGMLHVELEGIDE